MELMIISLLLLIFLTQLITIWLYFKRKPLTKGDKLNGNKTPISQMQQNNKESLKDEWNEEVKRTVELQLMRIRNAVQKQTSSIHKKEIELAPKSLIFDEKVLMHVYNEKQRSILQTYISSFHTYLQRFWYTKNGKIKTVFPGTTENTNSEVAQLSQASHELCHLMDTWIKELQVR
ncbi:hypothetical protein [Salipaludibacillus daqingensis]|uniref:hypothetical protein n=1 Tax=Salipaludibacillus daqingensis TaxID=3041001 RepID=UPI0024744939|nr:hypothetical protein [Salipaludibacillus daqingensis]